MLLRGPQTIGDLYSRTQRMTEFNSPEDIEERLQTMCDKTSPIVIRIPRQSGQREDRYMHVLSGAIDLSQLTLRAPELKTVESSQAKSITESESNDSDLRALVQKLEERVAVLEEKIEELLS